MYRARIRDLAPAYDPRHVEAYMRSAHATLDGLSEDEFKYEVRMACACVDQGGWPAAERLAQSFGMKAVCRFDGEGSPV